MNRDIIRKMTTKYYKTLKIMVDHKVEPKTGLVFVPMTQVEIAQEVGVSKITMNAIIKSLKEDQLLYTDVKKRGRYYLTNKALTLIEGMEALLIKMNEKEKEN